MVPLVYPCLAFEIVYRCFVCLITRCKHRIVWRECNAVYAILMVPLMYRCLAFEIVYRCFPSGTRCKQTFWYQFDFDRVYFFRSRVIQIFLSVFVHDQSLFRHLDLSEFLERVTVPQNGSRSQFVYF